MTPEERGELLADQEFAAELNLGMLLIGIAAWGGGMWWLS